MPLHPLFGQPNRQPNRQPDRQHSFKAVRRAAVAGMFYPDSVDELNRMVDDFFNQAESAPPQNVTQGEVPIAVVAPHAGYVYSGLTAAYAYRTLITLRDRRIRDGITTPLRIFLLGPSHRVWIPALSVGNFSAYETPLGSIPLDLRTITAMAEEPDISTEAAPHIQEHSLEVHLPFLQKIFNAFQLIPVVFGGDMNPSRLAQIIERYRKPEDLLIISSDLSHFHDYETAKQLDAKCHQAVDALDPQRMQSDCKACGNVGIAAVLELARQRAWRPELVDYRNSGDTAGDKSRVVGYASYLFYATKTQSDQRSEQSGDSERALQDSLGSSDPNSALGAKMLLWIREHLKTVLQGGSGLGTDDLCQHHPELLKPGATFITLKKAGNLRGCIGSLKAHRPLIHDLLDNSVGAALRDPRFPPVTAEELTALTMEVSILSDPEPLSYHDGDDLLSKLKPGYHGVILNMAGRRSTFLPQVWDQLPDKKQFLSHLCQKAGLNGTCWQNHPEISLYHVTKYSEKGT